MAGIKSFHHNICILLFCTLFCNCNSQSADHAEEIAETPSIHSQQQLSFDTTSNTIHVFVALCDNQYQGIVPVPAKIGNGQDPGNNLYWGCAFGIRTYFKNSSDWVLVRTLHPDTLVMERLIFKHRAKNYYLVADAYNGKYIRQCTEEFLQSCSGGLKDTLHINNTVIGTGGNARLVAYIGHNGLMDFDLTESYQSIDNKIRDCIILACYSKSYFTPFIKSAKSNPLVWTTGLMAPEAYTLHDALTAYINNEPNEQVRTKAALAYSAYQHCSEKAARNLLVTGW